jgi:glyoxylase-like metal-dependent hydrolase (beta-lactamase superfamily II)
MKLLILLLPLFVFAQDFSINKIKTDVWIATDYEYFHSNILFVKIKDVVVIVSSPYESKNTTKLVTWIKQTLKPKHMIAINDHYHLDATGGNQVFHFHDVETWASDVTNRLIKTELHKLKKETLKYYKTEDLKKRVIETQIMPANNTFDLKKGKIFSIHGEEIKVFFPGEAHAKDNVVVYFPKRKLLFGGCMIKPDKGLGWLRDANVSAWEDTVTTLLDLDVETVIPGHGNIGSRSLIVKTIQNVHRQEK